MLDIQKAVPTDYQRVRAFYHDLIDAMAEAEYHPRWQKDIYPDPEDLKAALERGQLYMGLLEGEIAAAMTVNHEYNPGYVGVAWQVEAKPEEISVLHILGVHPRWTRQGLAREMVGAALDTARAAGQKTLRLDVLAGNLPAERLYPGLGFQYIDRVSMYYEDTGWMDFLLFEYPL